MNDNRLTVYAYGEARGSRGLAGTAVVVVEPDGRERQRQGTFLGIATPAQAQYQAIADGLRLVGNAEVNAELVTDYEPAFRQLTGRSTAHIPEVAEHYAEAVSLLSRHPNLSLRLSNSEEMELAHRIAAVVIESRGRRTATD